MSIVKIAIGSKNPVKVAAVCSVMERAFGSIELVSIDVCSGVSEQPFGDRETLYGAKYRARGAVNASNAEYGVGCEGGVYDTAHGLFLTNWAVVMDREYRFGVGSSARMRLPECIAEQLRAGRELGPVMDEYANRKNVKHGNGAIGVFTNDLVVRKESFEHAVAYALAPFLHPDDYFR